MMAYDHPYESYGNGLCIHCGQIGSYIHTPPEQRGELLMADDIKTTTETTTPKPEPTPEPTPKPEPTTTTTTTEPADEDGEDE